MENNEVLSQHDKLKFYQAEVTQESNFYWMRFTAFSAMNAGLMSISSTDVKIGYFGLVLSLIWLVITISSIAYQKRYHENYHKTLNYFKLENNHGKRKVILFLKSPSFWGMLAIFALIIYWFLFVRQHLHNLL
ncbi:hypothetical protein [Shewanella khirikhana]|uniref:hypothetical protein n=1 Tax=Shewanella khirikhana TaxID=1965282 RepID=UPI000F7E3FC2|nr:hypothetical protein [Shewanella khirikhana]